MALLLLAVPPADSSTACCPPCRIGRWLGSGLFSDLDAGHHAAMKDILLPAFKAQSVKDLVPLFVEVGRAHTGGQGQERQCSDMKLRSSYHQPHDTPMQHVLLSWHLQV